MATLAQQAAGLRKLKLALQAAESRAKDLKTEFLAAEQGLLTRMEAEGVQSIKHDNTNFVPVQTVYGAVQDRSEFIKWAEETQPELLETRERKAILNEMVRQHLDDGEPLPPGLGFYVRAYISQRGSVK